MNETDKVQNKALEDHIEDNKKDFKAIHDKLDKMLEALSPIADTYKASTLLIKWSTAIVVFISVCLGVILSIKQIFKW